MRLSQWLLINGLLVSAGGEQGAMHAAQRAKGFLLMEEDSERVLQYMYRYIDVKIHNTPLLVKV